MARALLLPVLVSALLCCACGAGELLPEGSPDERFARVDGTLARGKETRALEAYRALARIYTGTDWEERARIGIARSYRAMKDYPAAIQEYETFARRYPRSEWVDDAAFEAGLCYADQRKRPQLDQQMNLQALDRFNDFLAEHPESDLVPRAREEVRTARDHLARKALENGVTYAKLRRYGAARFYFRIVVDDYPETEAVPEALYQIGRTYEREKAPERAAEVCEELR
ncbi:MAG: outer membrane protein assembly factor BamD, partial [Candidatus Eisenbacteria bacterium]